MKRSILALVLLGLLIAVVAALLAVGTALLIQVLINLIPK